MRRLLFLAVIILIIIIFIVRRRKDAKQAQNLLIEDICQSFEKEFRESKEGRRSASFGLARLRQIRKRYGDEIAKKVASRLRAILKEKKP
jgi:hypothetical protein